VDNKVEENTLEKKEEVETLEHTEVLNVEEKKEEAPATAEEIIKQAQAEANKAAEDYSKKEVPVAPQQDRIQLIDTKPKLHAVQLGGVTMATEKKEVSEHNDTK
jgi:regulator of protease activity HflC (stomatin/prohibitin superfamily)